MSELSNFIRERMSGAQNGSQHPDADTITAYMEQCLSAPERETVAAHFAVCEPCREVLALSQPQVAEAPQTVLRPAPIPAWRRLFSPKFGIAALVASMAIIAVLVLQLPHQADQDSHKQQAHATVPNQIAPTAEPQSTPTQPVENQLSDKSTAETQTAVANVRNKTAGEIQSRERRDQSASGNPRPAPAPPLPPPAKVPVLTAKLKQDYVNKDFFATNASDVVLAEQSANVVPQAPQPQAGKAGRAFDPSFTPTGSFSDLPTNVNGKSTELFTRTTPPDHSGCKFCSKVAQATVHTLHLHTNSPALRAGNLGSSALGGPGMFSDTLQKSQSSEVQSAPEKADSGSLANSDALSSGALGGSSPRVSQNAGTVWKVAGGKLIKSATPSIWEDAYPAAAIQFAVVSARGNNIWAGGNDAALIHSRDGGATWEIVRLGDGATGTIVGITADSGNVLVKTSDNQAWSSTDGGKTWSLQQ
jgi:hypothetical protein